VLVTDLVEPARATTLDQLDEGRLGLEIATAWLRSKASRVMDDLDPAAPETAPR
jgi:alkanesulfonate monooxygenase SsuD/methylene tetrahydromethanopterin reductase-like flavin-dependent oxidoreductase (luciferase family)